MDLTTGSIPKKVIRYTVPLVCTALIQLLFNAADLVVVGLYCGSKSVAAVGSTTSIIHLLIELFFGFAAGVSVTVAQAIGAKKPDTVSKAVHTAIPLGFVCGAILILVGVPFSGPGLRFINTPEDILPQATLYMQIYFLGVLPQITYNFGAAILHANGETKKPLVYLTISGLVNILLNLFFVIVLNLDVVGVALATTISQTLSCVMVLVALSRRKDASRLNFKMLCFHGPSLKNILRVGLPSGLQNSFYSIANIFVQSEINSFGTAAVAGGAAATSIGGFIGATITNFGTTALNFVGQNYGAKKYDRVRKSSNCAMVISVIVGITVSALALIFARPLLSIYIPDSEEALNYGVRKMLIVYSLYATQGVQCCCSGSMRGLGVSMPPMINSIIGIGVLRLVWLYVMVTLLGFDNNIDIIFLTFPISWTFTMVLNFIAWQRTKKRILVPLELAAKETPSV